jgi:hypothetical protein
MKSNQHSVKSFFAAYLLLLAASAPLMNELTEGVALADSSVDYSVPSTIPSFMIEQPQQLVSTTPAIIINPEFAPVSTKSIAQPRGIKFLAPASATDYRMIQRTVNANNWKLQQCYEIGLHSDPTLKGVATARFSINQNSQFTQVSVTGLTSRVSECMSGVFSKMKTQGVESVSVTYSIEFSAASN